jgi:hypothetical protein
MEPENFQPIPSTFNRSNDPSRANIFYVEGGTEPSQNASPLNDAYQDHDDRNNKKYVDEPSHGVRGYQSEEPEDQQYDCDSFEHVTRSFVLMDKTTRIRLISDSQTNYRCNADVNTLLSSPLKRIPVRSALTSNG